MLRDVRQTVTMSESAVIVRDIEAFSSLSHAARLPSGNGVPDS